MRSRIACDLEAAEFNSLWACERLEPERPALRERLQAGPPEPGHPPNGMPALLTRESS